MKKKLLLIVLTLFIQKAYSQKIGYLKCNADWNLIIFSNDTLKVLDARFNFNPDSTFCIISDVENKTTFLLNYNHDIIWKKPINYDERFSISYDGRIVSMLALAIGEIMQEINVKLFNKNYEIVLDTIMYAGVICSYSADGKLFMVHALNPFGIRGITDLENEDTKFLIFDKNYRLVYDKFIVYHSQIIPSPEYDKLSNKYILIDSWNWRHHSFTKKIDIYEKDFSYEK